MRNGNQLFYEAKDWQEAFQRFYEEKKKDSSICLVLSWASYTSGYWIEHYDINTKTDECKIYRTIKAVKELEQKIKDKREASRARFFQNEPAMSIGLVT